jgi:LysM repeat protein
LLLAVASGCFQPAGGGLEATNASEALPTFTMIPSDTPTPIPPTETPQPEIVEPTATLLVFDVGTPIAQVPPEDLDPIWQTATAIFLEGQGISPLEVVPLDNPTVETVPLEGPTLDPLLQEATALVGTATAAAALPITQTYEAMFGATPTAQVIQPTNAGPVLSGTDCVYEVQPTDRNLYQISLLFGLPYMDIARASSLVNPNLIHVGDRLIIPGCGTTGYQPPPTTVPGPGATIPPGGGSGGTYVVVAGDTLFALSLAWGTTVNAIAALNAIPNVNLIYIGQTLQIP